MLNICFVKIWKISHLTGIERIIGKETIVDKIINASKGLLCQLKGNGNFGKPETYYVENWIWKKSQKLVKLKNLAWFGMIFENIQSDPPTEVRGQSWPQRSIQKHFKMTSNYILVDGLGWYLRIFNLTCLKRSEAKVDLWGHFKNMSKWLQITY